MTKKLISGSDQAFMEIGRLVTKGIASQLNLRTTAGRGTPQGKARLSPEAVLQASRSVDVYRKASRPKVLRKSDAHSALKPAPLSRRPVGTRTPVRIDAGLPDRAPRGWRFQTEQDFRREQSQVKRIIRFKDIAEAVIEFAPAGERVQYAEAVRDLAAMGHRTNDQINRAIINLLSHWEDHPLATWKHANKIAKRVFEATEGDTIWVESILCEPEPTWNRRAASLEASSRRSDD